MDDGGPQDDRSIGGFRPLEVLGRGGMGVVYRATAADGRPAALKVLPPLAAADGSILRRFAREARVRLDHPNICRLLDAGTDEGGTAYIAFELLQGRSLAARLLEGPLPPAEVVSVGTQTCAALAAAHAAGIVHRDVKPANLFLCEDGTVKLIDFGIALGLDGASRMTAEGKLIGTAWYTSPEQAAGMLDLDRTTDIWALGAVLYECLAGRPPLARETPLASVVAVLTEELVPLEASVPGCPPGLATVIERALRKPRELRWPDARAFGDALAAADLSAGADRVRVSALPEGEQRLVAILLAEEIQDASRLEREVRDAGGVFHLLFGGRALGLFGGDAWEGDEIARALGAGLRARAAAGRIAVASGRATPDGGRITGAALNAAEAACALGLEGVALDESSADELPRGFSVRRASGPFREVVSGPRSTPRTPPVRTADLVGRVAEAAQLRLAADMLVGEGRSSVLLITGPPGIGKSRLALELREMLESSDRRVWIGSGHAEPLHSRTAFSLMASVLRERVRTDDELPGRRRRDPAVDDDAELDPIHRLALEAAGGSTVPDWADSLAELAGLSGPAGDRDPSITPAEAQIVADRRRQALFSWIESLCATGPTALLLEDLQWADPASVRLLEELAEALADFPLLVCCTARPEFLDRRANPFAARDPVRLRLQGLSAADCGELAARAAGRELSEAEVHAIAERTLGNPLFVSQIALALGPTTDGSEASPGLPLPQTVEAAVQSRLDHLLPAEKTLCKQAAVLGRPFLAAEIEALGSPAADAFLSSLVRKDILASRPRMVGGRLREFRFRSTLFADVAYGMLADGPRRELHRRAAAMLATRDEDPEERGYHHERAAQTESAADCYLRATLAAAARGDSTSVVRGAEACLRLGVPAASGAALHLRYAEALGYVGRREDQAVQFALALEASDDPADRARIRLGQAELAIRAGRAEEALGLADEAAGHARRCGRRSLLATVRGWQVVHLVPRDRLAEAEASLREAEELVAGEPARTRAFVATCSAVLADALGDPARGRTALRRAVDLYREAGDMRRAAGAEVNLAGLHLRFGAVRDAVQALETARQGCRKVGWRSREGWAACHLGYALVLGGRTEPALVALDQALAIARAEHEARLEVAARLFRARALLRAGEADAARREATGAFADAEQHGLGGEAVGASATLAFAALALGEPRAALSWSSRAMERQSRSRGFREDEADVFLAHGAALAACGRSAEAEAALRDGRERLLAGAARIGDPEARRRFLEDVPRHRELLATAATDPEPPLGG